MNSIFKKITLVPSVLLISLGLLSNASHAVTAEQRVQRVINQEIQSVKKNTATMQWSFEHGGHGKNVSSGATYKLLNLKRNKGIGRQKRRWSKAADLGWSNGSNIKVKKRGGGVIRYGDVVALQLKSYGWLKYQNRGRGGGINLGAPKKGSAYVWRLAGGKTGDIIKTGHPFSLRNTTNRSKYVKYCKRSFGIDLGWGGQSCGGAAAWVSNTVWGENGSASLAGRFCRVAATSGRVYATAKSAGMSEATAGKYIKKAVSACSKLK